MKKDTVDIWRPKSGEAYLVKVIDEDSVSTSYHILGEEKTTYIKDTSWFTTRFIQVKK